MLFRFDWISIDLHYLNRLCWVTRALFSIIALSEWPKTVRQIKHFYRCQNWIIFELYFGRDFIVLLVIFLMWIYIQYDSNMNINLKKSLKLIQSLWAHYLHQPILLFPLPFWEANKNWNKKHFISIRSSVTLIKWAKLIFLMKKQTKMLKLKIGKQNKALFLIFFQVDEDKVRALSSLLFTILHACWEIFVLQIIKAIFTEY